MKRNFLVVLLLAIVTSLSAQYRIDLSKVTYPEINYLSMGNPGSTGKEIRINNLYMEIGGKPQLPVMGEFHYNRMDCNYWKDALMKMKASGVNIVSTYALWALHEETEGKMSWENNLNLRRFVQLCGEVGLLVHLRFGPYCNAEIVYGALPEWLYTNKKLKVRSNDPLYLSYVHRWYQAVYDQVGDLLYKDNGPIMGLQLENEYVKPGLVVPHLMTLKKMAVEIGFDVPIYSMTHWMNSDYPKGEIVPYAGYYIETPWTSTGKNELPISDFEYFSYNRLSNNIGTDIIKVEGEVESLSGESNDSPYFTCEVGVGTATFYNRRAVVPKEMAGENINLRLGCGVNLMGYYMYVGGSNPVGEKRTFESSGPRINYDYQAPIREFGTLGAVMYETKKYNYFMNDFGCYLAPLPAYLPTSNQITKNLQWAVRTDGERGFLFYSNYLYKHDRLEYKKVQFEVKLKEETLRIPRKATTVKNGSYLLMPFNLTLEGVLLKYATIQPICTQKDGTDMNYFFFADNNFKGELLFADKNIKGIDVSQATVTKERGNYFIDNLKPGKECIIVIHKTDDTKIRLVVLERSQSEKIWKGTKDGKEWVGLTDQSVVFNTEKVTLIGNEAQQSVDEFLGNKFETRTFNSKVKETITMQQRIVTPMQFAEQIKPAVGNKLSRIFIAQTWANISSAVLRYKAAANVVVQFNGEKVESEQMGEYNRASLTKLFKVGENELTLMLSHPEQGVIAEVEVMLSNGERWLWNSDGTWTGEAVSNPAIVMSRSNTSIPYAPEEHLAVYELTPSSLPADSECETRFEISFKGNTANAYFGRKLANDIYFDGGAWKLSLSRYAKQFESHPLTIRIEGLKSAEAPIYFEKGVTSSELLNPKIEKVVVEREYRTTY